MSFELRLLHLAHLVIPSRPPLFWERGIVLLLMDAVGLSLLEEYVRTWYIRWYVVFQDSYKGT